MVEIKDVPKPEQLEPTEQPKAPKGAIPKKETDVRSPVATESVMDEFEECIKEFRQGEISTSPRKRRRGYEPEQSNNLFYYIDSYFIQFLLVTLKKM